MSILPAYLEQFEQKIQTLLADRKFNDAYKLCIELLNKHPKERKLVKLKEKIEADVRDNNNKIIKQKLKEIDPLWDKSDYSPLLKELAALLKFAPHNEKLKKLYYKAQKKYKEQIENLQSNFREEQSKRLNQLLKKNEAELIDELFLLERNNPGNQEVLKLTKAFRDQIIKKRIKAKEDLIYSEKYQDLFNFIDQLKKIDKLNPEVIALEKLAKARKTHNVIENKSEFVYKGQQHLANFLKFKKYDKAIKVAKELLEIDKDNPKVQKMLKKAQRKFRAQCVNETVDSIIKTRPTLEKEFTANKDQFKKL